MATVADVMVKDVLTVAPSDTIGEAAEKMHAANVGAVVVVEDMVRIVGIVTERDLLRAVAARTHSSEARVREWMTADPITAGEEMTPEEAAAPSSGDGLSSPACGPSGPSPRPRRPSRRGRSCPFARR